MSENANLFDILLGSSRDADHVALAIALLFERYTSASLAAGLSDDAAVTTLSTIWRKTLYGQPRESLHEGELSGFHTA